MKGFARWTLTHLRISHRLPRAFHKFLQRIAAQLTARVLGLAVCAGAQAALCRK